MNLVEHLERNKLLTNIVDIEIALKQAHKEKNQRKLIEIINSAYSKRDLISVLSCYYCPQYFGITFTTCDNCSSCEMCWRIIVNMYRKEFTNEKS